MDDIRYDMYYIWLISKIECDQYNSNNGYDLVLKELYKTSFYSIIPRDNNRAGDGLSLRDHYALETGYYPRFYLPEEASVLEVIIALAIRMERILYDPEKGSRVSTLFWIMMDNLGLTRLTDDVFSYEICQNTLKKFLNREYGRDGKGGLFYTNLATFDFKNMEIWYQMSAFIEEFLADF